MNKRFFFALLLAVISCASEAGELLLTPKHIVVIVERCREGEVVCGKVTYTGVDRQTGASISLEGSEWFVMCADGTTPCHKLGWRFTKGDTTYQISDEGELVVTVKDKVVLVEQGKWLGE